MKKLLIALVACMSFLPIAGYCQQSTDSIAAPPLGSEKERLLGDLGGLAPKMVDKGVILLLSSTHFYQGLISGSGDEGYKYGGKADAFLILDGGKLGLWEGFTLISHGELRYGKTVFNEGGNIVPANTALLFPKPRDTKLSLSSLYFIQEIGEKTKFMFGRINTVDFLAMNHYYGGRGTDGFMNLAFTAPPLDARTTPVTTLGALFVFEMEPVELTLGVWDAEERINEYSFSSLFENGVAIVSEVAFKSEFGGRPGKFSLGGTWSNLEATSLEEGAKLFLPDAEELPLEKVENSWVINFTFEQNLVGPAENPKSGWGIFGRAGISDGNPNPFRWSVMGGVAGCPITNRPQDRFGIGYYHAGVSSELKDNILQGQLLKNENGAEAYYSYALLPWFILTADMQFIDPFRSRNDNAWYGGLRAKIKL